MRHVAIPATIAGGPPTTAVRHTLQGETMGTTWTVDYFSPAPIPKLQVILEAELEKLNAQMSHWRNDSLLSRFNAAPTGMWITLPPEFFAVLQYALKIARQTNGAFDPALGDAVNAWGFGPKRAPRTIKAPLWRDIHLAPATRQALQPGGATLDLSAIAKGFAVDQLSRILASHAIEHSLVEIGGELRAEGMKPDGPWWVAIEPPSSALEDEFVIALHNTAIATSGDYRRSRKQNSTRYSHTIDPSSCEPMRHPLASVSVIAPTAMAADAYSTALTVMGPQAGLRFANARDLPALFILRNGSRLEAQYSQAFAAMLA